MQLLALLGAFALLVGDAAAGFTGRLARSLALATATVFCAVAQVAGLNGFDVFHNFTFCTEICKNSLAQLIYCVNHIFHTFLIYRFSGIFCVRDCLNCGKHNFPGESIVSTRSDKFASIIFRMLYID